jgi:hypothetical protein
MTRLFLLARPRIVVTFASLAILACARETAANPIRLTFDMPGVEVVHPGPVDDQDGTYLVDVTQSYDVYATITNQRTTTIDLHGYGSRQANVGSWDFLMDKEQIGVALANVVLQPGESYKFFWGTMLPKPSWVSDAAVNSGSFSWELFVFLSLTQPETGDVVWDGYFPRLGMTNQSPVPEPTSLLLLASGSLAAIGRIAVRSRRASGPKAS